MRSIDDISRGEIKIRVMELLLEDQEAKWPLESFTRALGEKLGLQDDEETVSRLGSLLGMSMGDLKRSRIAAQINQNGDTVVALLPGFESPYRKLLPQWEDSAGISTVSGRTLAPDGTPLPRPIPQRPEDSRCPGCMSATWDGRECPTCTWPSYADQDSSLFLPPGFLLGGRYLLGRVLGRGGFGITYLGWDTILNIKVAIKEYFPMDLATRAKGEHSVTLYTDKGSEHFTNGLEKFIEEARMLARFEHVDGIVSARDFVNANGTAYVVMLFHEGRTLKEHLRENGGRIPVVSALDILAPVMRCLEHVHEYQLLHRDVSPENIHIGDNGQVHLLDFGAARYYLGEQSHSLSIILKPGYAPEEQYRTRGDQGPWTDIYSVAGTISRAVTGVTPPAAPDRLFRDDWKSPLQSGMDIPLHVDHSLRKAFAVRSHARFQSMGEFMAALEDPSFRFEQALQDDAPTIQVPPPVADEMPGGTTPDGQQDALPEPPDELPTRDFQALEDAAARHREAAAVPSGSGGMNPGKPLMDPAVGDEDDLPTEQVHMNPSAMGSVVVDHTGEETPQESHDGETTPPDDSDPQPDLSGAKEDLIDSPLQGDGPDISTTAGKVAGRASGTFRRALLFLLLLALVAAPFLYKKLFPAPPDDPAASSSSLTAAAQQPETDSPSPIVDIAPPRNLQTWTEPTTGIEFVWIESGCFMMGSRPTDPFARDNEQPRTEVCLDGFWMSRYEVTNAQFRIFDPDHSSGDFMGRSLDEDDQPVVFVSWHKALAFATWLEIRNPDMRFHLPTEAQWEYAARAGTETAAFWGDSPEAACTFANVHDLTSNRINEFDWDVHDCDDGFAVSAPVGSFRPNQWGLHDMMGNVWEWTRDLYAGDSYAHMTRDNPVNVVGDECRVRRSGGWGNSPNSVRSAVRNCDLPDSGAEYLGIRLVRYP